MEACQQALGYVLESSLLSQKWEIYQTKKVVWTSICLKNKLNIVPLNVAYIQQETEGLAIT